MSVWQASFSDLIELVPLVLAELTEGFGVVCEPEVQAVEGQVDVL